MKPIRPVDSYRKGLKAAYIAVQEVSEGIELQHAGLFDFIEVQRTAVRAV
jgi:hypothetical protein